MLQRDGIFDAVFSRPDPAKGLHAAPAAQSLTDVLAQGADIGTLGAPHPEAQTGAVKAQVCQLKNGDGSGLALHLLALSGQLVELFAVDLQSRIHGGHLENIPPEPGKDPFHISRGEVDGLFRQRGAGHVLGVRGPAQKQHSLVGLFRVLEELHPPGGPAHEDRQDPRGHRVQGPAVANAPGGIHPAQSGGHILACPTLGLIDNDNAVHRQVSSITFSTAETAWDRVISMVQPAAPLWPPPPKRSAITVAS